MTNAPPSRRQARRLHQVVTATTTDEEVWRLSFDRPDQFATIFDRHWAAIRRYCVARAGAAGEDIASETFRVAFDSRDRFDPARGVLRGWMFGIAAHLLRRQASDARRWQPAAQAVERVSTEDDDVESRLHATTTATAVRAALGRLRPEEREVIEMVAWTHLTYSEIADALDIPVGTVRSRIARGRERLIPLLQADDILPRDHDRAGMAHLKGTA